MSTTVCGLFIKTFPKIDVDSILIMAFKWKFCTFLVETLSSQELLMQIQSCCLLSRSLFISSSGSRSVTLNPKAKRSSVQRDRKFLRWKIFWRDLIIHLTKLLDQEWMIRTFLPYSPFVNLNAAFLRPLLGVFILHNWPYCNFQL